MDAPETRIAEIISDPRSQKMQRAFSVERATIDDAARTVELSFASEMPVERWFGMEILDISESACDLSRLNNSAAVLVNHDWNEQVGVVLKAWIDLASKKARCLVKFSRGEDGEEIFQDIKDGIRSLVSVGYIVRKMVLQSSDGGVETHRVTDWQPFEVSVVSVPADTSVGVGRSQPTETPATAAPAATESPKTTSRMSTPASGAVVTDFSAERQRVKDILASARVLAGRHASQAEAINNLARTCAEEGATNENFQARVLNEVLATSASAPAVRQVGAELGLSQKEVRSYSLLRAIGLVCAGKQLDGIEREASEAEAKRLGRDASGFFVPAEVFSFGKRHAAGLSAERRELLGAIMGRDFTATTAASNGGYLVGQQIDEANMVQLLRNQSHVLSLGARVLTGLVSDVAIPRVVTGSTVSWVSENGSLTSATPTFGQITMKPRRIGATGIIGKQLIAQSASLDVEAFYRETVMADMGVEIDRVAINGAGGAEPLGVLNLATADRATSVTFGAAPTWAKVVSFETLVETANALGLAGGPYAYLTTPGVRGAWKTTAKAANQAIFLWENDMVNGYAARSTNQVPSNKVIFGQFGQVIFGEWAGVDIVIDNVTLATTHQVKVTIQKLMDMVIRQGKAFSISTDAGNQ